MPLLPVCLPRTATDRAAAKARVGALLTPEVMRQLGEADTQKPALIGELTSDWLRDVLRYDAPATLGGLTIPILALNGSLDRQVPAEANLAAIRHPPSARRAPLTATSPRCNWPGSITCSRARAAAPSRSTRKSARHSPFGAGHDQRLDHGAFWRRTVRWHVASRR